MTPFRRIEENDLQEESPPQVEQVEYVPQSCQGDQIPIVGGGYYVPVVPPELSNSDIKEALLALA